MHFSEAAEGAWWSSWVPRGVRGLCWEQGGERELGSTSNMVAPQVLQERGSETFPPACAFPHPHLLPSPVP